MQEQLIQRLLTIEGIFGAGVPWWVVVGLRNRFRLRAFIESGTGYGDSALIASQLFAEVQTIEIDPAIFEHQREELKAQPNVRRILGSGAVEIPRLCEQFTIDTPLMFFLDGHWSGAGVRYEVECPLLAELDAVLSRRARGAKDAVLIDNWGMFTAPPDPPHRPEQWPTAKDVLQKIAASSYVVTQIADVLCLTPAAFLGVASERPVR